MKYKILKTFSHTALLIALSLGSFTNARAEESGSGHYLPGAAASFIDALPGRPGLAVVNFFTFYDASASASRQLPFGGSITAGIDATVYADTLAGIYTTPLKLLGGDYAVGLAFPFVRVDVEGTVTIGPITGAISDEASGPGDMTLYPFMLGWTDLDGDLKYDLRLGIYAPTGDFDVGALANVGKNFWTFEPMVTLSYLSSKIGLEVSAYAGLDFNTNNDDTDYQTGDQFHLDMTVAQHLPLFGGFIGVGANGFYYQQISGDSGSGAKLGDFEGRTVGVGPVLSYAMKIDKSDLVAEVKWLPELDVENRLEGDYVWFKLAMAF